MAFLRMLENIRNPFLDFLMSAVTHLGEETLFMFIALIFFWCIDKRRGYYLLFAGFTGTICIQLLKMTFRIPRPWILDPDFTIVESARAEATGYSFPSGHTQCAIDLYGGIAHSSRRRLIKIVCITLLLLIAFSRMYLGVHTPLDVGVSLLIGLILMMTLYPIIQKTERNSRVMYIVIAAVFLMTLGNLLFNILYTFPPDVDTVNRTNASEVAWKMLGAILAMGVLYPVDEHFLRFPTQAVWWVQMIKLTGGMLLILAVRILLKAPLNTLCGVSVGGAIRYFFMVITAGILWPLTFRWFSGLGKTKKIRTENS